MLHKYELTNINSANLHNSISGDGGRGKLTLIENFACAGGIPYVVSLDSHSDPVNEVVLGPFYR